MIAQGAGPATTYGYDHAGKRISKITSNSTEIYFYGISGQKLATKTCTSTGCPIAYNVYFGGKLVKSKGVVVVTDRLGSVRANSNGETMRYYPYGEERTATADNREKFGTYTRDSATQDYADQRYYAVGMGRFNSPDPSKGVNPSKPASWNKYSYVVGDPINLRDRRGLWYSQAGGDGDDGDDDEPEDLDMDDGSGTGSGGEGTSGSEQRKQGGGASPAVDQNTNSNARGLLKQRLVNFKDSNCWKVLSHEGIKVQNILDHYNDENFYDVRDGSQFANQTQANIGIAGSDQTTLSASLGGSDAVTVGTLGSASTTAVLLGKQYFFTGNTDANRQNSLLHEMLHALGGGTDTGILTNKYLSPERIGKQKRWKFPRHQWD